MMMRQLLYSAEAFRVLDRLPSNIARRIRAKLEQYVADPAALAANVKALKGQAGMLRMRIGDWRVLFTDSGQVVRIVKVAPRGSAYDRL